MTIDLDPEVGNSRGALERFDLQAIIFCWRQETRNIESEKCRRKLEGEKMEKGERKEKERERNERREKEMREKKKSSINSFFPNFFTGKKS